MEEKMCTFFPKEKRKKIEISEQHASSTAGWLTSRATE